MNRHHHYLMPAATIVLVALSFVTISVPLSSTSVSARGVSTSLKNQSNAPKITDQERVGMVVNKHRSIVERLKPGVDFQSELKRIAAEHNLKAGVIVSAVGSFRTASLRFAGANEATTITGPLEVVSVIGTISEKGMHVHLSVSDANGKTIGGHLMPGCKVFTTIELAIFDLSNEWSFERKTDEHTTYLELDPQPIDVK